MGVSSIMNDAGRIGFVIKGNYDNATTYEFLDVVYYNNATYVAKKLTVGNAPQNNSEFWQVLVNSNVDFDNISPSFVQAETRANINSGEKISILFGKIKKYFADMKTVAFSGSYDDLTDKPTASDIGAVATSQVLDTLELINANTTSGNVAGALGVKEIRTALNNNINALKKKVDGTLVTDFDTVGIGVSYGDANANGNPFPNFWTTVQTFVGNNANYKQQLAYSWDKYNTKIAFRVQDGGVWYSWKYLNVERKSASGLGWYNFEKFNEYFMYTHIDFDEEFVNVPSVVVTDGINAYAAQEWTGSPRVANVTHTGFDIYLQISKDEYTREFSWIAVSN